MHRHESISMRLLAKYLLLKPTSFQIVIPAKAGIHSTHRFAKAKWIPAFAGMTKLMISETNFHPTRAPNPP